MLEPKTSGVICDIHPTARSQCISGICDLNPNTEDVEGPKCRKKSWLARQRNIQEAAAALYESGKPRPEKTNSPGEKDVSAKRALAALLSLVEVLTDKVSGFDTSSYTKLATAATLIDSGASETYTTSEEQLSNKLHIVLKYKQQLAHQDSLQQWANYKSQLERKLFS